MPVDVKITDLPAAASANQTDFFVVVDMSGEPTTKKIFASAVSALAPVQTVASRTGAVTLTASDITDFAAAVTAALPLTSNATGTPGATAVTNILAISQADYDALVTKNETTLYVIV
jgi:hypothetical protein